MSITGGARVSVVVATRDRPEILARCIASILASEHDDFELIVVDQSRVQTVLPSNQHLRHIRTGTAGKSAALNLGVRAARGSILAFTDDDCTVPPEWLARAESLFVRHPEVEMAFGNLVAIDHDPSNFVVPTTHWKSFQIVRGRRSAYVRGGAGADLIARRRLFDVIGEWDELIGPGSRFRACEEWDLYYRALASGAAVALAPELVTLHWGSRLYSDGTGQTLYRGYAYGEGAVIGKHLRLADFGMLAPAMRIVLHDILQAAHSLGHGRRPAFRTFVWKCRGMLAGALQKVDRDRRVFLR